MSVQDGPIFIPPDVPGVEYPTGETTPEGVTYFRIYAATMLAMHALTIGIGVFMLLAAFVGPSAKGDAVEAIVALVYIGIGALFASPFAVALLGGRRTWVHTLATVGIAMSMLSLCCVPFAIPVLIHWQKPETKRWFAA